jgi:putative inorganic carbon (HCO3(-)) transporter
MAISILLGVGLWLAETSWRWRALLAGALASAGLALVWSYARSAWLGLVAGLVAFGALHGKRYLAAAVAVVLAVGALAYVASPTLAERLQRMGRSDDSLERIYTWKTTLAMIGDHPLVGVGLGGYRRTIGAYRSGYNIHWTAKSHAHNSYLQFAAESGAPAGLLFAGFLGALAALGARRLNELKEFAGSGVRRRLLAGTTAAVIGFAAASLLQHNAGDAEVCMQFQLAAALAAGAARGEARETHEPG